MRPRWDAVTSTQELPWVFPPRVSFYNNQEETTKQIQKVGHSTRHTICVSSKTVSHENVKRQGAVLN